MALYSQASNTTKKVYYALPDKCHRRPKHVRVTRPTHFGVATAAVVGGLLCNYSYDISPRLAVPVIIVGYFQAGLAILAGNHPVRCILPSTLGRWLA